MNELLSKIRNLVDPGTVYFVVIPMLISLLIGKIFLAIMFYDFVIRDLRW